MELSFENRASISKRSIDFEMVLRFQNGTSISKWIEFQFQNGASISKSNLHFEMELRFQNGASISKWSFDFEMELRFQLKGFSHNPLYRKEARGLKAHALVHSPLFIVAKAVH